MLRAISGVSTLAQVLPQNDIMIQNERNLISYHILISLIKFQCRLLSCYLPAPDPPALWFQGRGSWNCISPWPSCFPLGSADTECQRGADCPRRGENDFLLCYLRFSLSLSHGTSPGISPFLFAVLFFISRICLIVPPWSYQAKPGSAPLQKSKFQICGVLWRASSV